LLSIVSQNAIHTFGGSHIFNLDSVILITTAAKPPEGVFVLEMTNISKRIISTKAAVFFWSALGVKKIVIADATGHTLLDNSEVLMLNQMEVEIEQIHYLQDNDLVIKKGKGYGEGHLINFALQNSSYLSKVDNFFKCTGKVYCRNFLEIHNIVKHNNIQNIFWRDVFDNSIDTRFFYTSKDFFHNFLFPVFNNIDDRNNKTAENLVFKMAYEHLKQGTTVRPMLSGFSGSLNRPYFDSSLGFLDSNLPCWTN
jgi:hypothetical protein